MNKINIVTKTVGEVEEKSSHHTPACIVDITESPEFKKAIAHYNKIIKDLETKNEGLSKKIAKMKSIQKSYYR